MFDIAWSELGIIAAVALLIIGPKDLPKVLRTVGQWIAKARSMAREFQSGIDDMVREAELDDLRKAAKDMTNFSLENEVKKSIDPDGALEKSFRNPDPIIDDPFAEPKPGPSEPEKPAAVADETPAAGNEPKEETKP